MKRTEKVWLSFILPIKSIRTYIVLVMSMASYCIYQYIKHKAKTFTICLNYLISLRGEEVSRGGGYEGRKFRGEDVWVHKTSLTPSDIIEVTLPSQKNERSCTDFG